MLADQEFVKPTLYRVYFKRALDVVLSGLLLLLFAPVFLMVAALIRLDSPGPIFHRTRRLAKGGGE